MPLQLTQTALDTIEDQIQSAAKEIKLQRALIVDLAQGGSDLVDATKRLEGLIHLAAILEDHRDRMRGYLKELQQAPANP